MDTVNTLCLSDLPGYAPRGTKDRAGQARLSLAELDHALGVFLVGTYNQRAHSETGQAPQSRWEAGAFLPGMPDTLEQLDLLLLTVAKPRKVHTDGIHFQSLRYLDPALAAYTGEHVTLRYDPRDLAEIRVFHQEKFLTRRSARSRLAPASPSRRSPPPATHAPATWPAPCGSAPASSTASWPSTPNPNHPLQQKPPDAEEPPSKLRRYREE